MSSSLSPYLRTVVFEFAPTHRAILDWECELLLLRFNYPRIYWQFAQTAALQKRRIVNAQGVNMERLIRNGVFNPNSTFEHSANANRHAKRKRSIFEIRPEIWLHFSNRIAGVAICANLPCKLFALEPELRLMFLECQRCSFLVDHAN